MQRVVRTRDKECRRSAKAATASPKLWSAAGTARAAHRLGRAMPKVASLPWWLADGDEECPHCGHLYVLELEFRCSHCDGPGCPHCKVTHAAGHVVCPECIERTEEESSDGR